ncbi:unnamed protein product [Rotaria magnacalcarata]|uniref:Uncharacterized protein n=1 Tax=Rotaria magnacalcarata TaxID=392030 RepID=A0A8S2M3J2_9BILA|nr:unnamed protein product [Rotaria magnacalcarata]
MKVVLMISLILLRAARLQERWNRYQALPEKTQATAEGVCGRPTDAEIGVSGTNYGSPQGAMTYKPTISGFFHCQCTNDLTDIRCGLDGSFMGIRCPDNSACARKCCRQGWSGGHCRGFLRLKCRCH